MGWCDDPNSRHYNKLIEIKKNLKSSYEELYRKDNKYDLFILIKYNYKKVKKNKGRAIFLHLTKDYSATKGCVAIKKKDFLIRPPIQAGDIWKVLSEEKDISHILIIDGYFYTKLSVLHKEILSAINQNKNVQYLQYQYLKL